VAWFVEVRARRWRLIAQPAITRAKPDLRIDPRQTDTKGTDSRNRQRRIPLNGRGRMVPAATRVQRELHRTGLKREEQAMATAVQPVETFPWWKEPTREQWHALIAAWLGWTLDAFDFTIFLLLMVPIAHEFRVSLAEVTAVFTLTLWMRLIGATASGWLSDRIGRKTPLMIAIAWYSICNLLAGLSPAFWFLFLFRALLGIGMGAEWPVGAALAMETWPQRRSSPILVGPWRIAVERRIRSSLQFDRLRGLLIIGVAPALLIVYVQFYARSRRYGSKTGASSASSGAKSDCRSSASLSGACSAIR
jgi:hypothetical protein